MTKTESIIANRQKNVVPKYSPLVNKIVNGNPDIGMLESVKWGKLHEDDASRTFMAEEAVKHDGGLNKGVIDIIHNLQQKLLLKAALMVLLLSGPRWITSLKKSHLIRTDGIDNTMLQLSFSKGIFYLYY